MLKFRYTMSKNLKITGHSEIRMDYSDIDSRKSDSFDSRQKGCFGTG